MNRPYALPALVPVVAVLVACGASPGRVRRAERSFPPEQLLTTLRDALDEARMGASPDPGLARLSLAPLVGLPRDRIEHALGSPTLCPPCLPVPPAQPGNPRDQVFYFADDHHVAQPLTESACIPCSPTADEFYRFEGGMLLLLHFDAAERCTSAEWIAPRVVD